MPKRISKKKRPSDVNQLARYLVDRSTDDSRLVQKTSGQRLSPEEQERQTIRHIMAEMGRRGGGKRRLQTMTPNAAARWPITRPRRDGPKRKVTVRLPSAFREAFHRQ